MNEFRGGTASHGHFYVTTGTALHWAAYYGQLEIAKLLIEHGAGTCYCSAPGPHVHKGEHANGEKDVYQSGSIACPRFSGSHE